jgi:hypothetical protein
MILGVAIYVAVALPTALLFLAALRVGARADACEDAWANALELDGPEAFTLSSRPSRLTTARAS